MSSGLSAEKGLPRQCGKYFASHPTMPHLTAVCTLLPDHDGDCDNLLTRPIPPAEGRA